MDKNLKPDVFHYLTIDEFVEIAYQRLVNESRFAMVDKFKKIFIEKKEVIKYYFKDELKTFLKSIGDNYDFDIYHRYDKVLVFIAKAYNRLRLDEPSLPEGPHGLKLMFSNAGLEYENGKFKYWFE